MPEETCSLSTGSTGLDAILSSVEVTACPSQTQTYPERAKEKLIRGLQLYIPDKQITRAEQQPKTAIPKKPGFLVSASLVREEQSNYAFFLNHNQDFAP